MAVITDWPQRASWVWRESDIKGESMDNEHRLGRIAVSDLENAVAQLPEDAERGLRTLVRCYTVIKHFFGDEWLRKNIVFAGPKTYLGFDFSSDIAREEKTWRLGEISEMLFNLQDYDGFASCIEQMEHGDFESVYAELEIAKWLHVYNVKFRFNRRRFIKQSDYDLEIVYPEAIACADTKCKVETTEINAGSIADSIRQARTQLPPNRPGIVFIKVPEPWLRSREMTAEIFSVARNKISGTGRIVSVKLYSPLRIIENQQVGAFIRFGEITNPRHRFKNLRLDWNLFSEHTAREGMRRLPESWVRMVDGAI